MLNKIKDAFRSAGEAFCRATYKTPEEQLKDDLVGIAGCIIIGYFVHSICTMRNTERPTRF